MRTSRDLSVSSGCSGGGLTPSRDVVGSQSSTRGSAATAGARAKGAERDLESACDGPGAGDSDGSVGPAARDVVHATQHVTTSCITAVGHRRIRTLQQPSPRCATIWDPPALPTEIHRGQAGVAAQTDRSWRSRPSPAPS